MPTKKPAGKEAAGPAGEPERVGVGGLRTLGDVEPREGGPDRPAAPKKLAALAHDTLRGEFERILGMLEKLRAESSIGGKEKGRDAARQQEKARSLVASLEGMNRFALAMGLVTPAESRELYADAMKRGLYEGWQ